MSNTLINFIERFKDEESCQKYLYEKRMKTGFTCPHCSNDKIYTFKDKLTFKCAKCRKKFNIKTGTIFAGSKISLRKWFLAIFLLTTNKKGISSIQLAEQLGVTQKTAWFIDHRIRETYKQGKEKLNGTVEIDETYVGGKQKNKHKNKKVKGTQGRSCKTKAPVVGMVQRNGRLIAKRTPNATGETIENLIFESLDKNKTILIADEYRVYNGIADERVNHSQGKYVIDTSHTNTIENFWSLLKRGILGIYHSVSIKHLQRYIDEFVYRYNDRKLEPFERVEKCLNKMINKRFTYKKLVFNG